MHSDLNPKSLWAFIDSDWSIPPTGLTAEEREQFNYRYYMRRADRLRQYPDSHAQEQAKVCMDIALAAYAPRAPIQ